MDEVVVEKSRGLSRRAALKGLGAGAAVAWVAPAVLSTSYASAAGSAPPVSGACVFVTPPFNDFNHPLGATVFTQNFNVVWDGTGVVVLAGDCGGFAPTSVDDKIEIDGPGGTFVHNYVVGACAFDETIGPLDISSILNPGSNSVTVRIIDDPVCGPPAGANTPLYIVPM